MEQYAIKGGNPLVGEVEIGGAKNAALPILAAAVMTDETVSIDNIPDVRDTNVLIKAVENIGVMVRHESRHKVIMNASGIHSLVVEDEFIKKIRASYYLIGALLGKYRYAEVALPGGCNIGSRAIDQHIKGFRALGAEVCIEHGLIKAKAQKLTGSHIYMDVVSVGATINVMMAAVLAEGRTIIENAAKEPHVVDLAKGHVKAVRKLEDNSGLSIYNLGTGKGYSVLDIVKNFEAATGVKIPYSIKPRRAGDVATCYSDATKAKEELGWEAEYDIKDMCADSWNFQQKNPNGYED